MGEGRSRPEAAGMGRDRWQSLQRSSDGVCTLDRSHSRFVSVFQRIDHFGFRNQENRIRNTLRTYMTLQKWP